MAIGDALLRARPLAQGVDWHQIIEVLEALAISPVLGLVGAGGLYALLRLLVRRGSLFEPPKEGQPPVWWMRGLLILTCTSVSFSHGTNDGQKSIGLIMLTVIGLMPATFALNPNVPQQTMQLGTNAAAAAPLIQRYGDDVKAGAVAAARALQAAGTRAGAVAGGSSGAAGSGTPGAAGSPGGNAATPAAGGSAPAASSGDATPPATRAQLRGDVYAVLAELKHVGEVKGLSAADKAEAARLHAAMGPPVQYAPIWVRVLSALCLGAGTMVGYKRVVRTLGERLGKQHMTPGQGASAELVGSLLIGTAGFTGLPVSTTHIVTSGIAGTMIAGGQGLQAGMLVRIVLAWVFTLPVTMALAGGLFYVLDNPHL